MIEKIKELIELKYTKFEICEELNIERNLLNKIMLENNLTIKQKRATYSDSDIIGKTFGILKVVSFDKESSHRKYYNCLCECGNIKSIRLDSLISGNTKSCGCLKKYNNKNILEMYKYKNKDMYLDKSKKHIGEVFENLTIIDVEKISGKYINMVCECVCGKIVKVIYSELYRGKVKSCGCYQKEQASKTGSNIGLNNYKNNYNWYFVQDNKQIKCRSGFEVIYANYLIENNIDFEYESKCFKLDNGKRYTPDFYLISDNKYVEIKGSFKMNKKYNHQKDNIKLFKENHNWCILYWDDLVKVCKLPLKTYSSYLSRARKLNIKEEDYLGNRIYLKI